MRSATLGGLEVSVLGLGCNTFGRSIDQRAAEAVVHAALDVGMTFFDTSDNYGGGRSEAMLGSALGSRRDEVRVATKFGSKIEGVDGTGGARPEYVGRAVRRSLEQLGTEWIDLYQLHRPDPDTPIAETLGAMWDLVDEGLVREIGCSNLDATQLSEAVAVARAESRPCFISNQIEYSLLHRDPQTNGLRDLALAEGIALLPFYPLANGMLTGKVVRDREPEGRLRTERYRSFLSEHYFDAVDRIRPFAESRGLSMVQVALGWLLAQPDVPAVTPGSTKPEQVRSNARAATWQPSVEDLELLDGIEVA